MKDHKLVSYTVRWTMQPVDTADSELREKINEFLLEHSDFSEARQVLDRIRSK